MSCAFALASRFAATAVLLILCVACGGGGGGGDADVVVSPDALLVSSERDGFSGTETFNWETTVNAARLELRVRGFHAGNLRVRVRDANDVELYSAIYWHWDNFYVVGNDEYLDIAFSSSGAPGTWTVELEYTGFIGHLFLAVEDTTATGEPLIPAADPARSILSTTFGIEGRAAYDVFRTYGVECINDGAGRVIMVGSALDVAGRRRMAAWRFTSDGGVDINFGTNGIAVFDDGVGSAGRGLTMDGAGRIYLTGWVVNGANNLDLLLVRLNNNGSLDGSFGLSGFVTFDEGDVDNLGCGVAVDINGRIVVAGNTRDFTSNLGNAFVQRYFDTGAPDATFAGGSVNTTNDSDRCQALVIDPFNRPTLVGTRNDDVALWRFTSTGLPDLNFGSNGVVGGTATPGQIRYGTGLDIRPTDGAIAVSGYRVLPTGDADLAVWRFNDSGAPETTFSGDGFASYAFPGGEAVAADALFDGSDRLILAGVTRESGDSAVDNASATLWRFEANGVIDLSFAVNGVARFDERSETNVITA
ncbi:MAG: hypothetical protein AAF488_10425, partial [Planctomycetota bacterium]